MKIVDFAITNISNGVQKSLDLGKEWLNVVLGKTELVKAVDSTFELAKHWTFFGINLVKQIIEEVGTIAGINVKPITGKKTL